MTGRDVAMAAFPLAGLLDWQWSGFSGMDVEGEGHVQWIYYRAAVPATVQAEYFPPLEPLCADWIAQGWTCQPNRRVEGLVTVRRTVRTGHVSQQMVWYARLIVRQPEALDVAIKVTAQSVGMPPSPWQRQGAQAWWCGERIAGGKGQRARIRAAEAAMRERLQGCPPVDCAYIPYATRGGRGGWKDKTALHAWYPEDRPDGYRSSRLSLP